ncbi:MAG: trypsin-like peptidase domain-containing protein [Bryobacteraceae bacterium]
MERRDMLLEMASKDDELTHQQLKLLRDAFVASYSDFDEIRRLVRFELDDRLTGIASGIALEPGVDRVISWAENNGRMNDLIAALIKDRPRKQIVQSLRDEFESPFSLPAENYEGALAPAHWSPKDSGLERIVVEANPIALAGEWRARMAEAERRVCRIEAPRDRPWGTGFLVGKDLILTNCHVFRQIQGKEAVARFDYTAEGATGVERGFKGKRPIAVSTEDKLDFALLRLDAAMEPERGWFEPKAHTFRINQVHLILQHPQGNPLGLGIGVVTSVIDQPARVTYNTNTEGGSSGSPAFTMDWQLVAIHKWGSAQNNAGIPMGAIWKALGN